MALVYVIFTLVLASPTRVFSQISCPRTCQSDEFTVRRRCDSLFQGCEVYSCGGGLYKCDVPYPRVSPIVVASRSPTQTPSKSFQYPNHSSPQTSVTSVEPSASNYVSEQSELPRFSITIVTFISPTPSSSPLMSDLPPPHIISVPTIASSIIAAPSQSQTVSSSPSSAYSSISPSATPSPSLVLPSSLPSVGFTTQPAVSTSVSTVNPSATPTSSSVLQQNCSLSIRRSPGRTIARCECEVSKNKNMLRENGSGLRLDTSRYDATTSELAWFSGHNTFGETACMFDCTTKELQSKRCLKSDSRSGDSFYPPLLNRSQVVQTFKTCCIVDCGAEWIWNRTCISGSRM